MPLTSAQEIALLILGTTDNGRDLVRGLIELRAACKPNDRQGASYDRMIRRSIGVLMRRGVRVDDLEQSFTQAQAPAVRHAPAAKPASRRPRRREP